MPHEARGLQYPFPAWVRYVDAAIPVSLAVAVSIQRDALVPLRWPALIAGLAAAPWVLGLFIEGHRAIFRPLGALVVLGAVVVLVLDPADPDMAAFFLVYLVAHEALVAPKWESAVVLGASVTLMVSVELAGRFTGSFIWVLGFVVAWAGGLAVRSQLQLVSDLETAQSALAEQAVAEERQRIAREIHDVVAHTLSVTMLYVTGARLALQRDPQEAEEALLAAERLGRESLAEIRRTVGLLAPDASGTEAPMPTATDVPDLVDEFRAAGLGIDLTLLGDVASVPPATGLAVYRIAQESLTNVVKHAAGARAILVLEIGDARVCLKVRNPVTATTGRSENGDGLGVRGMKQRAELLGGTLWAGPEASEWVVEADVPVSLVGA